MGLIKTITHKKTTFYQHTGSQAFVLKQIKDDKDKSLIHIHNDNKGRMWGAIPKTDILKWIKKNNGLFEVITEFPHKVYFDIDGEENETVDLQIVKDTIYEYFGRDTKMAISGYKTDEKHSYHICLYEYGIFNEQQRDELKALATYISQNIYKPFDWKVYTKNRFMKAINQSKPKKSIQKIIEDDNEQHHLITFFTENIIHQLPTFSITKPEIETIKLENKTHQMDYSTLPKMEMKLPDKIDLNNPIDILSLIPTGENFNHSWSWRVALFCANNGLTCNDFLSWAKQKSDDENRLNKWKYIHWPRIIELKDTYPVSIKAMLKTLQQFYPNILQKPKLRQFSQLFENINSTPRYTDYLTLDDFETDKKAVIVNIQMGGGKTHNTIEYLKKNDNFCWITPNIALSQNTHMRIENVGINCVNYQHGKNVEERKHSIASAYNIIICLNSLIYIKQNYDVIVIDEIETFLKLWFNNGTLARCLNDCWAKFIELLKSCKKLILLDAFISKMTTDFLDDLRIDYIIIKKTHEANPRSALQHKNFRQTVYNIIQDLRDNKKCLIFYPYKREQVRKELPSMEGLVKLLQKRTNTKGTYHNADVDKNNLILADVNENWTDFDFVVSNNKINVGLNFDVEHFDNVYIMMSGFNSPRDIVQFSFRPRSLKSNLINFCFLDTYNPVNDVLIYNVENENDIYQRLFKNVLIEKRSPVEDTLNFFLAKANYTILDKFTKVLTDDKLKFENLDYYSYDNLKEINSSVEVEDLIRKMCAMEATLTDKLNLKRFYYDMNFKEGTPIDVMGDIWNNKKLDFMDKCLNVLYKNEVMTKLKNNYGWQLLFPEEIKNNFTFEKQDLEAIFNQVDFRCLTQEKSRHNVILSHYINTVYGVHMLNKKKNSLYKINNTLKEFYINIVEHHNDEIYKPSKDGCLIHINEEEFQDDWI